VTTRPARGAHAYLPMDKHTNGPRTPALALTVLGTAAFTGAGLATTTIAVMAGAFQGVPRDDVPDAGSTVRIVQQVGGAFGAAVLAIVLAHELLSRGGGNAAAAATDVAARAAAFDAAFWWAIGFGVLAVVPALFLPGTAAGPAGSGDETRRTPSLR
jgi:hypothetical protein